MRIVPRIDMGSVVRLINEYATATRAEAGESDSTYPTVLSTAGLDATVEEAVAVADSLFAGLRFEPRQSSSPVGREPQKTGTLQNDMASVRALNDLITDAQLSYRLDEAGHLVWVQPDSGPLLLGAAVASVVNFVSDSGIDRIGFCSANRCIDVYADHSRGGQRQYCSEGCGARSRVARWRQHQT